MTQARDGRAGARAGAGKSVPDCGVRTAARRELDAHPACAEGRPHVYFQATRVTDPDSQEPVRCQVAHTLGTDPVLEGLSGWEARLGYLQRLAEALRCCLPATCPPGEPRGSIPPPRCAPIEGAEADGGEGSRAVSRHVGPRLRRRARRNPGDDRGQWAMDPVPPAPLTGRVVAPTVESRGAHGADVGVSGGRAGELDARGRADRRRRGPVAHGAVPEPAVLVPTPAVHLAV